jgi:hypothetical protein
MSQPAFALHLSASVVLAILLYLSIVGFLLVLRCSVSLRRLLPLVLPLGTLLLFSLFV